MKKVTIYTDGACSGNPGSGGYGALLKHGPHEKEIFGGELKSTNQRMEIRAAIEALKSLKYPCSVVIYTDSKYVINGITSWIHGWIRNGWKNSKKKPVINKELWEELYRCCKPHEIRWKWVRGHSGNIGNERADELAKRGIGKSS